MMAREGRETAKETDVVCFRDWNSVMDSRSQQAPWPLSPTRLKDKIAAP
jgi:hypothetical protein